MLVVAWYLKVHSPASFDKCQNYVKINTSRANVCQVQGLQGHNNTILHHSTQVSAQQMTSSAQDP